MSEIVARPDLARPVEGTRDAIAALTQRYRTVAIVTGRRSEEVAALLDLPHVMYVGLYGFEEEAPELLTAVVPLVETAVRGRETPRALVDAADVVVEEPAGLVGLLRTL